MDDATKNKLADVLARKRKLDAEELEADEQAAQKARQLAKDRAATDARWLQAVADIKSAIVELNEVISDDGIHFELGNFEAAKEDDKYGGISVLLRHKDKKDRYVHFNISDVGKVRPVFLLPYSGKHPKDFGLATSSQEQFVSILSDFVAQVVGDLDRSFRKK